MTRMPGVRAVAPLFALSIGLVLCALTPATRSLARQETAPVEVGAGPVREQSLGLSGRNLYGPDTVRLFGYLTTVIGLDPALLFTDATPSERTARFTYAGDVTLTSRTDRGDVTAFDGAGTLRIFLNETGGGSWDEPNSFADGQPVAELTIRLLDTLHRQAPGVGVVVGDGQLTQQTAAEFTLDGARYRFGAAGIEQRLRYVGALLSGDVEPGSLSVGLTGAASVATREAIPINVGRLATPAAATQSSLSCPDLQTWLSQTLDGLSQAESLGSAADATGDVSALDAEALRQEATEVALLVETQRAIDVPAAAVEANQLIVTALSTYARGLNVIATAAGEQDADFLAQGQAVISDGSRLLERAEQDVRALEAACAEASASDVESSS